MTALSLHLRVVALLSQEPSRPSGMVCVRGVAWHDGDHLELRDAETHRLLCTIPDALLDRMLPVRDRLLDVLPGIQFYVVCSPTVIQALVEEARERTDRA